jgi:Flp pilus assembly protein TadD
MRGFIGTQSVGAAALAAILLTAPPSLAQSRITPEEFLASEGAKAFQTQDFNGAVDGFQALLASYPGDPLLLRYIGITLDRLGRYDEAVEAFDTALKASPGDVAILFFLGVSQYNRADFRAAESAFAQIAANAPETDYGVRAREFLAAIEANVTHVTAPAAQKRWNAYVQLGLQYDDNVAAAPDGTGDRRSRQHAQLRVREPRLQPGQQRELGAPRGGKRIFHAALAKRV